MPVLPCPIQARGAMGGLGYFCASIAKTSNEGVFRPQGVSCMFSLCSSGCFGYAIPGSSMQGRLMEGGGRCILASRKQVRLRRLCAPDNSPRGLVCTPDQSLRCTFMCQCSRISCSVMTEPQGPASLCAQRITIQCFLRSISGWCRYYKLV